MTKQKTVPELVKMLERMTVARIHQLMVSEEITGIPRDPTCCPIAKYLGISTGRTVSAFPYSGITWYDRSADNGLTKVGTTVTPESVFHFMAVFDCGQFPELIQR